MENIENVHIDTVEFGKDLPLTMETIEEIFSDYHEQNCCESHWADWDSSKGAVETAASMVPLFDSVEIKGTPGMGFTLFFQKNGTRAGVFVACYSSNNGYYSYNLTLTCKMPNGFTKEYDIAEYQE